MFFSTKYTKIERERERDEWEQKGGKWDLSMYLRHMQITIDVSGVITCISNIKYASEIWGGEIELHMYPYTCDVHSYTMYLEQITFKFD